MSTPTSIPKLAQMIVTLEDKTVAADVRRALKLMRGVASVHMATIRDDGSIIPAMRRFFDKARREYAQGETISCCTPEEMQRYFGELENR